MRAVRIVLAMSLLLTSGLPALIPAAGADAPTILIDHYRVDPTPFTPYNLTTSAKAAQQVPSDNFFSNLLPIGFSTTFFDRSTRDFWVSANGFITMITPDSDGCCEGRPIPDQGALTPPNQLVAGFWTDLDPGAGGAVRFENFPAHAGRGIGHPNATGPATQVLVVEWLNVPLRQDLLKTVTFQIHVYNDGTYEIHWKDVNAHGIALTSVGIENFEGTLGIQVERSRNVAHKDEAIRFSPILLEIPAPAPDVRGVTPVQGSPGKPVAIIGANFTDGTQAFVGGVAAATTFVSSTRLNILVPHLPPGIVDVSVKNPNDQRVDTLVAGFTILEPSVNPFTYNLTGIPLGMRALTGAATTLSLDDEDFSGPHAFGFNTTFFGRTTSGAWVHSNGLATLLNPPPLSTGIQGGSLPDPFEPNGILAGFWTDLNPGSSGAVRFQRLSVASDAPVVNGVAATQVAVIEFDDVPLTADPTTRQTFQIQVYDNGVYEVHVESATAGSLATIGMEDPTGETGIMAFHDRIQTLANVAFRFTPVTLDTTPLSLVSLSPASGAPGTVVELTGDGFQADTTVLFEGVPAASVTLVSPTVLSATVPDLPLGVVDVLVRGTAGQQAALVNAFEVTDGGVLPPPFLDGVSPSAANPGATVQIIGAGFQDGASVFLGAAQAATTFVHDATLNVVVPSLAEGAVDVTVQNPDGQTATLAGGFTVLGTCTSNCAPPPCTENCTVPIAIAGLTPASGPSGTRVVVDGQGFRPGVVVRIGGIAATTFFRSSTSLEAIVPSGVTAGFAAFVATNADGASASAPGGFEVTVVPPAITFVSPDVGRAGDAFTVFGSRFESGARVFLGGHEAKTVSVSASSIRATVPSTGLEGAVSLRVFNPASGLDAVLPSAYTVLVGPRISGLSTAGQFQGEAFNVLGSGFNASTRVFLGGTPAEARVLSGTVINVTIPGSVRHGLVDVTVLGPDGRSHTLPKALFVLVPVDLAIVEMFVEKPGVDTDSVDIHLDQALGQRVVVTVRNDGGFTSAATSLSVTVRSAESSLDPAGRAPARHIPIGTRTVPALEPGDEIRLEVVWSPQGAVGDHTFNATMKPGGQEFNLLNNFREIRTSSVVSGARGISPCEVRDYTFSECKPLTYLLEVRTVQSNVTEATDFHNRSTLSFDVRMHKAAFEFNDADRIFDTITRNGDGSSKECTVWRFFGGRGHMMVAVSESNGISGRIDVVEASSRESRGTHTNRIVNHYYAAGIEYDDEPSPASVTATQPRVNYTWPDQQTLHLEGRNLKGDFTRCTFLAPDGTPELEAFTYAALPASLEQKAPNFLGFGTAQVLSVEYRAVKEQVTNRPDNKVPVVFP